MIAVALLTKWYLNKHTCVEEVFLGRFTKVRISTQWRHHCKIYKIDFVGKSLWTEFCRKILRRPLPELCILLSNVAVDMIWSDTSKQALATSVWVGDIFWASIGTHVRIRTKWTLQDMWDGFCREKFSNQSFVGRCYESWDVPGGNVHKPTSSSQNVAAKAMWSSSNWVRRNGLVATPSCSTLREDACPYRVHISCPTDTGQPTRGGSSHSSYLHHQKEGDGMLENRELKIERVGRWAAFWLPPAVIFQRSIELPRLLGCQCPACIENRAETHAGRWQVAWGEALDGWPVPSMNMCPPSLA